MAYRWNNFHEYFPGGGSRNNGFQPEIIVALDEVLPQIKFDMAGFLELIETKSRALEEVRQLYKGSRGRVLTLGEKETERRLEMQIDSTWNTLDGLLEPVFERMIALGFAERDLRG